MASSSGRQKRAQPANATEFHILLALADANRHGYGIMREIECRSQGAVRLGPGSLYGTLKRLLGSGLIEETSAPTVDREDGRRRRYYHITHAGRDLLREELRRLAIIVEVAAQKQLLPRTSTGGVP